MRLIVKVLLVILAVAGLLTLYASWLAISHLQLWCSCSVYTDHYKTVSFIAHLVTFLIVASCTLAVFFKDKLLEESASRKTSKNAPEDT